MRDVKVLMLGVLVEQRKRSTAGMSLPRIFGAMLCVATSEEREGLTPERAELALRHLVDEAKALRVGHTRYVALVAPLEPSSSRSAPSDEG